MNRFAKELRVNWRRVIRLFTFRRVSQGHVRVSASILVFFLALALASRALVEFVSAGPGKYFNEWGLVALMAKWSVIAIVLTLLTRARSTVPLGRAIADLAGIGFLTALPVALLMFCWTQYFTSIMSSPVSVQILWAALGLILIIWPSIALWRSGSRLWKTPHRFAGARLLFAAMIPLLLIPRQAIIAGESTRWERIDAWYWGRQAFEQIFPASETESAEESSPAQDYESAIYQQPAMVEQATSRLTPHSGDSPKFYFLGLAPSSAQSVFKSEVLGAKSVFETRLGATGRALAMINSWDTVTQYPMANVSNLDLALSGIARKMRPDRDVLALFITSHGNPGTISVSMPGYWLNNIEAGKLAASLKKSGIKHQVIIIAACYSGSFISALAGDNTLVMTASDASHTSFGCSNEREWTYFGDALFNHALKETTSLPQAFAKAKDLIGAWEKEQNLTPSNPQMSLGKNIEKLLGTINEDHIASASALD